MNDFNIVLALLGFIMLSFGLLSKRLEVSPFPPTLGALLFGIGIGPIGLNLLNLAELGEQTVLLEKAARLTLAIGLMGVALRIPRSYIRQHWRSMLVIIGLGMPMMWAISTLLVHRFFELSWWLAALIGAIITPTDPIAASPIVTGDLAKQHIPEDTRHAISFDSGANDGLAYLFVFLPFFMLTKAPEAAWREWVFHTLLWEVGIATIAGIVIGFAAGKLLEQSEKHNLIDRNWRLIYTVALALFAVGIGRVLNSDEVLVVFVTGAMFAQVVTNEDRINEEQGEEAINRFFAIPIFIILGTALPWEEWSHLGWNGLLFGLTILLLRRPPVLWLLRPWIRGVQTKPEALFAGWFGPIAIAAIYYATLMQHKLGDPRIWPIVSLMICISVILHGLSGAPFTKLLGRNNPRSSTSQE